jgi:hypothetical protein
MIDAKRLAMMQEQQNQNNARRSGKSGMRLLDDNENNVGNATVVEPQILPAGQVITAVKQAAPPRLLNLTSESKTGQSVTVVMTASRITAQRGFVGPLTGVIEFGNGTQSTKIEFDIPVGPYVGDLFSVQQGTQPEDSGAVIQVPTGIVRAYARYDDAYITPEIGGFAFGTPGSSAFPAATALGPNYSAVLQVAAPCNVKAFASYFGRHHSKLYKTLYLFNGGAAPVLFTEAAGPSLYVPYSIPPFAKSIQVVRNPVTAAMNLILTDQFYPETFAIPSGPCPVIPITGNQNTFMLISAAPADTVQRVKVIFEIGF